MPDCHQHFLLSSEFLRKGYVGLWLWSLHTLSWLAILEKLVNEWFVISGLKSPAGFQPSSHTAEMSTQDLSSLSLFFPSINSPTNSHCLKRGSSWVSRLFGSCSVYASCCQLGQLLLWPQWFLLAFSLLGELQPHLCPVVEEERTKPQQQDSALASVFKTTKERSSICGRDLLRF